MPVAVVAWLALLVSGLSLAVSYRNYTMSRRTQIEEKRTEIVLTHVKMGLVLQRMLAANRVTSDLLNQGWTSSEPDHTIDALGEYRVVMEQAKDVSDAMSRLITKVYRTTPAEMEATLSNARYMLVAVEALAESTEASHKQLKPPIQIY